MLSQLAKAFGVIHGVIFVLAGLFHVWFWIKRGFWVPRYIHAIALAAALIGIAVVFIQPTGELAASGAIRNYLFAAFVFPSLVYAAVLISSPS